MYFIRKYVFVKSLPRQSKFGNQPARIHSPDPFLRAGNAVSVLPNPYPQKIVWQNRVHRIGTRIPSVSPLEKPDLARHHHTKSKKRKPPPNQNRMRGGEARAERNSRSGGRLSGTTVCLRFCCSAPPSPRHHAFFFDLARFPFCFFGMVVAGEVGFLQRRN